MLDNNHKLTERINAKREAILLLSELCGYFNALDTSANPLQATVEHYGELCTRVRDLLGDDHD